MFVICILTGEIKIFIIIYYYYYYFMLLACTLIYICRWKMTTFNITVKKQMRTLHSDLECWKWGEINYWFWSICFSALSVSRDTYSQYLNHLNLLFYLRCKDVSVWFSYCSFCCCLLKLFVVCCFFLLFFRRYFKDMPQIALDKKSNFEYIE